MRLVVESRRFWDSWDHGQPQLTISSPIHLCHADDVACMCDCLTSPWDENSTCGTSHMDDVSCHHRIAHLQSQTYRNGENCSEKKGEKLISLLTVLQGDPPSRCWTNKRVLLELRGNIFGALYAAGLLTRCGRQRCLRIITSNIKLSASVSGYAYRLHKFQKIKK